MTHSVLIAPDIHCRDFYKQLLDVKDQKIIFLGDYMDPYSSENTSDEQGIANLEEIIDFAKQNNNVTLLVGNHDESYIWSFMKFERTSYKYYKELHNLYRENIKLFKPCIQIQDTLFSHAGVCNGWISQMNYLFEQDKSNFRLNESNICDYIGNEFEKELEYDTAVQHMWDSYLRSQIFCVGRARWGDAPYGGPFWADVSEHIYDDLNIYQVFGHTQLEETGNFIKHNKFICCDSRSLFEYDLDSHNINKI